MRRQVGEEVLLRCGVGGSDRQFWYYTQTENIKHFE
jgi:hypothetical protein